MKYIILFLFSVSLLAASSLNNDMRAMVRANGVTRTRLIDKINQKYNYNKIVNRIITYLKANDTEKQVGAVEASGIIRSKKYKKYIKKLIISTDDIALIDSLIFSIGANKYKSLTKNICKYISDTRLQKTTMFALTKLGKGNCKKEIKGLLKDKKTKNRLLALEVIMKTKDNSYRKELISLFNPKELSTIKLSSSFALLAMKDKKGLKYINKYLKELKTETELFTFYKELSKIFTEKNRLVVTLLVNGLKSKYLKVRILSGLTLIKLNKVKKIGQKQIDEFMSMDSNDDKTLRLLIRFQSYYKKTLKKNKKKSRNNYPY